MKITPTIAAPQVARILQLLPKEPIVEAPVAQKDTFEKNKVVPITFAYDKRGDAVISGQRPPDASFQVHEYARNLIGDLNNALHTIGANADMIRGDAEPSGQTAQDAIEIKASAQAATEIARKLLAYTHYKERQPE